MTSPPIAICKWVDVCQHKMNDDCFDNRMDKIIIIVSICKFT